MNRLLVLALFIASFVFTASAQEVSKAAPDFSLVDRSGQRITLADLFGTPVVLNFWATWCLPCLEELPIFQRASKDVGEEVIFLLVNNSEEAQVATAYLEEQGITLLSGLEPTRRQRAELNLDTTTDVLRRYRVFGMPTTFFINEAGVVQSVKPGPLSASDLSQRLAELGVLWQP